MEHINKDYTLQMLCRDTHNIWNEEGKVSGLPLNRGIRNQDGRVQDVIAGGFLYATPR